MSQESLEPTEQDESPVAEDVVADAATDGDDAVLVDPADAQVAQDEAAQELVEDAEIGRASCRERVC